MAKPKKPVTRRSKLRARIATNDPRNIQRSIRGDIMRLDRLASAQAPLPLSRLPKVPTLDAKKYGATGADMQFGEVIRELQRSIRNSEAQTGQNTADIQNWFGTARQSFETAAANNARSSEAAVAAQAAADAGIAASFGGGASEAAGALAQSAQGNQGYLRGIQQSTASADQANIAQVAAEGAGVAARQRAIDNAREAELRADLGDKRYSRGLAAQQLEDQARQTNWERAMQGFEAEMGAREFNRQGRQARFQNLSSLPALKLSALMAGAQLTGAETDILNALNYPTGGGGGGGGRGSGTPRLPNGMTPGEYARLIQKNDAATLARRDKVSAGVQKRRQDFYDTLVPSIVGSDKEGNRVDHVQNAAQGVELAKGLAASRGLDIRKPAVQNLIVKGLMTAMPGWNPANLQRMLQKGLPRPKQTKQQRRREQGLGRKTRTQ